MVCRLLKKPSLVLMVLNKCSVSASFLREDYEKKLTLQLQRALDSIDNLDPSNWDARSGNWIKMALITYMDDDL